jgi:geranylgeranyl pyrophosphate synthase
VLSCAAQTEELLLARDGLPADFSTDDALDLTRRKAGSLGRLAALIGAGLAKADATTRGLIADCFESYATYRQIIDDLSDAAETPESTRKSDASLNRPTLPLVYLHKASLKSGRETADLDLAPSPIMERGGFVSDEQLRASGALVFAGMVAEMLRNETMKLLAGIEQHTGRRSDLSLLLRQ